ncbi:hypothetical protein [Advenella sp. EE-W14]|uniref:hypothetical protein n=1 Tax=Advenella sp. EE-W14 TaxID=2722705 RepID=UPI00145D2884|nr:hypothetical protein [Advenella sp. EE-W14]
MDFSSISAAISSLQAAWTVATNAIDRRDAALLSEVKANMMQQLLEVSTAALELQTKAVHFQELAAGNSEKYSKLNEEFMEYKKRVEDCSRYELVTLASGSHVYVSPVADSGMKFPTYFCAACMSESKKTILQPFGYRFRCANGHPDILAGKDGLSSRWQ